jgi:hypothetical protein
MRKLQRSPPPFREPISKLTEAKPLTRLAINATTAPDGSSFLCTQHNVQPLSSVRDATPPRPIVVDAGGYTLLHLRTTSSQ